VLGAALALKSSMIGASPLLGISATITMYTRLTSTLPLISISGHVVRSIRGEWSGVEGGGWSRLKRFFLKIF
jgi:hypothetical protein